MKREMCRCTKPFFSTKGINDQMFESKTHIYYSLIQVGEQ